MEMKYFVLGCLIILIIFSLFIGWIILDYAHWVEERKIYEEEMEDEIEFAKLLNWEPENSTIHYNLYSSKKNTEIWKNLHVWICYEEQPWNNTRGHIWYTQMGEYYFEEAIGR